MQRKQATFPALHRRLLARASVLAMRVALRPRGWASGLLAVGVIGAQTPALAQEIIDLATDADLVIRGAAAFDFSGHSVSGAGDVNGDGIDDLMIGAAHNLATGYDAVTSYVVFGTEQGFPATIDLADPENGADLIIEGARGPGSDFSHISVSGAGDVNSDGIDDLIVGSQLTRSGASYVVFGTDQGFPPTILASAADLIIEGAGNFDGAGFSVSGAGDVNGNGIDDLIVGAIRAAAGRRYPRRRQLRGVRYRPRLSVDYPDDRRRSDYARHRGFR